ncbi:carboxypeptidase-like regulatory domain-containing protein [Flavobacterium wongokense]|uniref:carboxypeptidase-like regulatory domain-containing protein n=1 Tax=Flavobacterium wongokense TaxID=2910674 RepID=UPI001F1B0DA5|nr:carboxypeptidase-like regulatory domain-containing protein [Flavobacterium sp. WG47]MCF6131365.1 TonB-dependent receptor [Flavobacterium sp. WG47]
MKKLVISTLFVMQVLFSFAQTATGVTGKVVDSKTQKPLQNVVASIQNTSLTALTDAMGVFTFKDAPKGGQLVQIKSAGYKDQLLSVDVVEGKLLDLGVVVLEEDITSEQQLSLITITENDLGDDNSGSETTSGLLQASRDGFQQAAAFNWGQARFRVRGLDNEYGTTMINGVIMNKIYDGRPQWSNWGGLNDATRNQEFTSGLAPSDYTFGGILGTQEINTRASIYRKGSRLSFSGTNTNYSWRTMATHASGMGTNGWAFVVSASARWAKEGFYEGTDYDAKALFASVEKRFNRHHSLGFTSIYSENSRGKSSPNTDEVRRLAGELYNSYWGWDGGKKRNSRDKDVNEPILMLTHYWKITDKTNLNTSVAYQFGKIGNSRIDYQGADNPDPTYYRNLPSFYTSTYNPDDYTDFWGDDPDYVQAGIDQRGIFLANKQLNWDAMYEANKARNREGLGAAYILYEDRTDDKIWTANTNLNSQLADNINMNAGATFRRLTSHNFANMLDLLGADYFLDVDTFQAGSEAESDLNNPQRHINDENQNFAYNYNLLANTFDAFTQFKFTYKKIDFYLAESFTRTQYQREGLYKNGLYPTNSLGKSEKYIYENFGFKGGLTYKISGKQFFAVNSAYMTKAPTLRNLFPNARINDNVVADLKSENVTSADVSYIIKAPKFKSRLTAFWSNIKNATETSFYFGEGIFEDGGTGDGGDAFVAETVTGIEKQNIGLELGMEYQLTSTIKLTLNGAYGEYTYKNNPNVSLNNDDLASYTNTNPITDFGPASLKGYRLSGGPQTAASFGIEYRDPKFWWIGANANYLADNYMDVSALLRTQNFFRNPLDSEGLGFPEATPERAEELLKQEKFDDFYLVNLTGGKSWKIKNTTFGLFATINNVFDVDYKTGGFEQTRNANFREVNQDVSSGTPAFAPKYFYGYGRTYFVNLYVNF